MVSAGSHKKVIWVDKLGHEWTASVKSRVQGSGCPYCSHNLVLAGFNDLASRFPEIASEWSERNLPLTPDKVTAFKNTRVWWKCHLGHEWYTLISTRSGGSQCPYCSGIKLLIGFNDLATKYELSPVMISRWKKEFIENSAAAFETPKVDDAALEKQKDRYLRKIGDLEMQLDFAKRVSRQLGIEIPADD